MAFSFPASPTTGQQSVQNGRTYSWTGSAWELVATGSGLTWSSVPASSTATGVAGQVSYDLQYQYTCVSTNYWVRTPLTPWLPVTTGPRLWLDASRAATIFGATSGGSSVASGGSVKRWEDASGNNLHFTNDTSPPTLQTNALNGLPVISFNSSSSQYLRCATLAITGSGNRTVFVVGKATGTSSTTFYFALSDNVTDTGGAWGIANDLSLRHTGGRVSVFGSGQSDVFNIVSAVQSGTTSSDTSMWRNGVSLTASSRTSSGAINTTGTAMTIAAVDGPASSNLTTCSIAEILVYTSALSNTDRAAVELYLGRKWGIA